MGGGAGGEVIMGNKLVNHGDMVHGDKFAGDKVMGDKVEGDQISVGNIIGGQGIAIGRGAKANVNIQHGMAAAADPDKQALKKLIEELETALSNVPATHAESAEAVAQTTEALVAMAESESPNKTMFQINGEGLKQAAKNLAEITPDVLTIATGIVMTIGKMIGVG